MQDYSITNKDPFNLPNHIESQLSNEDRYKNDFISFSLGQQCLFGHPKEEHRGVALIKQAATEGNVNALHSLGNFYHEGFILPQSDEKAAACWQLAIEKKNRDSMYELAQLYKSGEGVPFDQSKYLSLLRQAANYGQLDAVDSLEEQGLWVDDNSEGERRYQEEVVNPAMNSFYNRVFFQPMFDMMMMQPPSED